MPCDSRTIYPLCAWRGSCAKRFSRGDDATLHCPDFSEDVTLRRSGEETPAAPTHPARKD
jgi:hypothetical protein